MQKPFVALMLVAGLSACAADPSADLSAAIQRCEGVWEGESGSSTLRACSQVIDNSSLSSDRASAYNARGTIHRRKGRYSDAVADFNEAVGLESGLSGAYSNRGITYSQMGEDDLAIESFRMAVMVMPTNPKPFNNYSWHLSSRGDYEEALEQIGEAIALEPNEPENFDTQAHALMGLGRIEEAEAAFERSMDLGGRSVIRQYQRALASKGYKPGRSDGTLDAETRGALSACIRDNCRLMLD